MMENRVFVEGNIVIAYGMLYARNIIALAGDNERNNADKIIYPENGLWVINEECGSIFTDFYVSGGFSCLGGNSIYCAVDEHSYTYKQYRECIEQIKRLLNESIIPDELQNLFYQQQYISVFGALECFLYNTFMRQVCNNRDAYKKVIDAQLKCLGNSKAKKTFKEEDGLEKEKVFIEEVQYIAYHNPQNVKQLFEKAFGIIVDLDFIKDKIDIRHDLVHRMGYTKSNNKVYITHEQVISLINEVDLIVDNVTLDIKKFNEKQILE